MGELDNITYSYISKEERYADLINYELYDGAEVVKPEMLRELDSKEVTELFSHSGVQEKKKNGEKDSTTLDDKNKSRDVIKALYKNMNDDTVYSIICIENQSKTDNTMPVRIMLYDAIRYDNQINDIRRHNRANEPQGISSGEYISHFHKEDRIHPVITIVMLWSPDEWDGPRSLHELFDVQDGDILSFVPDYKLNLIEPNKMDETDFEKFHTDLSMALRFTKYANKKEEISRLIFENNKELLHLEPDTETLIDRMVGNIFEKRVHEEGSGERVSNVFQEIVEDAKEEGRKEGRKEGHEEGRKEGHEEGEKKGSNKAFEAMDLIKNGVTTLQGLIDKGIPESIAKKALSRIN